MTVKHILMLFMINLVFGLLQTSFFPELLGIGVYINLILSLGFAFLLTDKITEAFVSVLIGGLIIDLLGVDVIGVSVFILTLLITFAFYMHKLFLRSRSVKLILVFIANMIYGIFVLHPNFSVNTVLLMSSLVNVALVIAIYFAFQLLQIKSDRYRL